MRQKQQLEERKKDSNRNLSLIVEENVPEEFDLEDEQEKALLGNLLRGQFAAVSEINSNHDKDS